MKKYELSQIGQFHTDHNEDFLMSAGIGDSKWIIAVMDGCSSGTDSYFASALFGKILRRLAKEADYKSYIDRTAHSNDSLLRQLMAGLFQELVSLNARLDLRYDELLSTLVLGIVDVVDRTATLQVIGDGIICCNGKTVAFENDNKPDYLAYHLGENFDLWYDAQTQSCSFQQISDLSISTDGIYTFKTYNDQKYRKISEAEILNLFFEDRSDEQNENMLKLKSLQLEEKFGLKPTDDLSIIRLIL